MTSKQLSFKTMMEELELQGFGRIENTPETENYWGINTYSASLMIPEEDKEYEAVMITHIVNGKEEVSCYELYDSTKQEIPDDCRVIYEILNTRQWKRFENEFNFIYDTIQNYVYKIDGKHNYLTSQHDMKRVARELGRL